MCVKSARIAKTSGAGRAMRTCVSILSTIILPLLTMSFSLVVWFVLARWREEGQPMQATRKRVTCGTPGDDRSEQRQDRLRLLVADQTAQHRVGRPPPPL